ncbi:hypothetical protein QBC39DRAFT_254798 [Podospora conica]|nr:hypothetical protein QBC39DRAFT_254798 [Schizothecium conicum]
MPYARGIKCFLSTNHGKELIAEYPHPDGASPGLCEGQGMWRYSPFPHVREDYHGQTKTNPVSSVYRTKLLTPPGSPFSIHYQIDQLPPPPCKYIFFKVHINGRQIVAWGIDVASDTSGRISLSLWLPGPLYDGMPGAEKRNLLFLPGQENRPIAEDGGLIEIDAFRASARQARAPTLNEFHYHGEYGVA